MYTGIIISPGHIPGIDGDNNITGTQPGDTHITSDMYTGITISRGHIPGILIISGIIISRGHIPGIHISLVIWTRG